MMRNVESNITKPIIEVFALSPYLTLSVPNTKKNSYKIKLLLLYSDWERSRI